MNNVLHSGAMFEASHSNSARNILAFIMSYFGTIELDDIIFTCKEET